MVQMNVCAERNRDADVGNSRVDTWAGRGALREQHWRMRTTVCKTALTRVAQGA